jgi:TP901 family phage tail tape measure protein
MALDTATIRIAAKVAGEEAVKSLAKQLEITDKEARGLIRTNAQLGGSAKAAAAGMASQGAASTTAAAGMGAARTAAAALASALAPLAALVGAGSIFQLGTQAETAEAKLRTMSRSIADFDQLAPMIAQVARETGNLAGPAELSAAAYEILSAGATSAADAAAKLKAGLILARGGAVDTATAVDGLTSIMNAYAVDTGRAIEVADKIRQTVDDGKISFEQYSTTIGRAAAVAAGAGVSLDELNAAIGTVTSGGIVAETAISGVRQLIVNLVKPTQDAKEAADYYGIALGAAALRAKGLGGVLDDIRQKTGGNAQAVAKLITDIDGLTAAQALFVKDGEKYKDLLDNQTRSYGSATRAADIMAQTTKTAIDRMKAAWESLAKRLVEVMQPVFRWLADRFSDLFASIEQAITIRPLTSTEMADINRTAEQMAARRFPSGIPGVISDRGQEEFRRIRDQLIRDRMMLSRQQAGQAPAGRRGMGTYTVNGITYDVATGRPVPGARPYTPVAGRAETPGAKPPPDTTGNKPRTAEEIRQSIAGLTRTAQIQALQQARVSATDYTKALLDYEIAVQQADGKLAEFMQREGVTAREVAAATSLRRAEVDTAKATLTTALKQIVADVNDLGAQGNKVVDAYNQTFSPAALLRPDENNFEAQVQARAEAIAEAVRSYIEQLEALLKELDRKGGPAAELLRSRILGRLDGTAAIPAKDGKPAVPAQTGLRQELADPAKLRGYAVEQVRQATAANISQDQKRELQGLQDQLQALLSPYGELTAVQSLELRLKRENIALSPEERAQRLADAAAIDKTREAVRALNEQQQLSRNLAEGIADAFREGFRGLLFQAQSLEEALSNIFGRLADQLFNIAFNLGVFGNPFGFNGTVFGQVLPGFQARAAGGPVTAGSPYLVGERGPELFVPRSSGTIVPNGGMGSTSVVVNVDARGTSVQGDNTQGQQLGRVITAAVQAELLRQKRPGGILARGGV